MAHDTQPGPFDGQQAVADERRQPRDRRLFLLANQMPEKLGRRYWWWSLIHLIVIISGGSGSLYLFGFK